MAVEYAEEAYNLLHSQGKLGNHRVEIKRGGVVIIVFIKSDGIFDLAYGINIHLKILDERKNHV